MNRSLCILASLIAISCATVAALASTASGSAKGQTWDEFWLARHVEPSPPKGFLGTPPPDLQVLNLTNGKLSDQTARRWARADWRRGVGDAWSVCHLRLDVVNAGVLGPPGLNGNDGIIASERAKGTKSLSCPPLATIEKMAVISVTDEMLRKHPNAGLTKFVIVIQSRGNNAVMTRTLSDGRKEVVPVHAKPGVVGWQLDTGEFRDNAVIGPVWYQANGWSCSNSRRGTLDDICGLVEPD